MKPHQSWFALLFSAAIAVTLAYGVPVPMPLFSPAYGYDRADDPLIVGIKQAIAKYRDGNFEAAAKVVKGLDWQVDELKEDLRVNLEEELKRGLESKNLNRFGYALTHLLFQALRQKFYWNLEESLSKYGTARARLDSAEFYYEEILAAAVKRADAAKETRRHSEIMKSFRILKTTLGSPGLFGVGVAPPDVEAFFKSSAEIEKLINEVFPSFILAQDESETSR